MPNKKSTLTIEISHRTVFFTTAFLTSLWLLVQIRSIIFGLFVSVILTSALHPAVDRLENINLKGIGKISLPRPIAIMILYILILLSFGLIIASIIPPLLEQSVTFSTQLPRILEDIGFHNLDPSLFSGQINSLPSKFVKIIIGAFSNLISAFTIAMFTFYFLLERKNLKKYLIILFGDKNEPKAEKIVDKIEHHLGGWIRGQLALMVIIGVVTYIGLVLLEINFALPLALIAAILEIVPNLGPTIAMVPAVLVGLTISPLTAIAVMALYFLIQQVENNVIVPKIMQSVTGLNPIITILSLVIGYKLAGIAGSVLGVPTALVIKILLQEFTSTKLFKTK